MMIHSKCKNIVGIKVDSISVVIIHLKATGEGSTAQAVLLDLFRSKNGIQKIKNIEFICESCGIIPEEEVMQYCDSCSKETIISNIYVSAAKTAGSFCEKCGNDIPLSKESVLDSLRSNGIYCP